MSYWREFCREFWSPDSMASDAILDAWLLFIIIALLLRVSRELREFRRDKDLSVRVVPGNPVRRDLACD